MCVYKSIQICKVVWPKILFRWFNNSRANKIVRFFYHFKNRDRLWKIKNKDLSCATFSEFSLDEMYILFAGSDSKKINLCLRNKSFHYETRQNREQFFCFKGRQFSKRTQCGLTRATINVCREKQQKQGLITWNFAYALSMCGLDVCKGGGELKT